MDVFTLDACAGVVLFVIVFIGLYILKQICPEGPRFTAIEIDEIRLERLDDIETNLQKNINALKVNTAYIVYRCS